MVCDQREKCYKTFKKDKKISFCKSSQKGNASVRATIKTAGKTITKTASISVSAASKPEPSSPSPTNPPEDIEVKELLHYNMTCSQDGKYLLDQSGNGNDAELVNVSSEIQKTSRSF